MGLLSWISRQVGNWKGPYSLRDARLLEIDDRSDSASGQKISETKALENSAWWRGINLLARDTGRLPLYINRRLDGGGKEPAIEHPAYTLLRWKPNPWMTANCWRETMTAHAVATGNAYSRIVRDGSAAPVALVPMSSSPQRTYPVIEDGKVYYVSTDEKGKLERLKPTDVFHLRGLSSDGIKGESVFDLAKEAIGLALGAERYASLVLKNGSRASVVLQVPAKLDPAARKNLIDSWAAMCSGENVHKTAVLEQGITANAISMNAKDFQLQESRAFQRAEIANFLCVPPHKLGEMSRASYSSLEQENLSYLHDLDPWLTKYEFEAWDKLLTEDEKAADSHTFNFLRNALLLADAGARFSSYHIGLQDGWLCRDEVRAMEDMNPIPGGKGKEFLQALNMGAPGGNPDTAKPPGKNNDPAKA